jgi:hypothetical protein
MKTTESGPAWPLVAQRPSIRESSADNVPENVTWFPNHLEEAAIKEMESSLTSSTSYSRPYSFCIGPLMTRGDFESCQKHQGRGHPATRYSPLSSDHSQKTHPTASMFFHSCANLPFNSTRNLFRFMRLRTVSVTHGMGVPAAFQPPGNSEGARQLPRCNWDAAPLALHTTKPR